MKSKFSIAMSLAVMIAMLITSLAFADEVTSDVVLANDGNQTFIDLGNVASGQVITSSTSFQLVCKGNNHADLGNTVNVQFFSVSPSGNLTATNTTIGPIPASWADDSGDCPSPAPVLDDSGNSTVTITAPTTAGTYDYVVTYKVCQSNNASQCGGIDPNDVTGSIPAVTFRITVVTAPSDTTAPSINCAIPDQTVWYGTDVTVNCTASDSGSGLANPGDASFSLSTSVSTGTETANAATNSRTVSDNAGNSAIAGPYTFKVDKKAPSFSCGSADGVWHASDVSIACTASDGGSGLATPANFSLSTAVSAGSEDSNASTGTAAVTDNVGNSTTAGPIAGNMIDKKGPSVTASPDRSADHNGWYNTGVTVSFSGTDGGSGLAACDAPVNYTGPDSATASVSGNCTDNVGNSGTGSFGFKFDDTDPSITASIAPAAAGTDWWNISTGAPTVSFTCSDATSGVDGSCPASHAFGEGENQSYSQTIYDLAGNSASDGVSDVDVDLTAPALNISGAASGTSSVCSALPGRPTFAPSDNLSSIASRSDSWTTPSAASGVGTYTYNATTTDVAGNTTSETRTYTVNYSGAFSGYLQPINADGSSRFKLGSTIPVKFQLTCNGVSLSNAVAKLYVAKGDNQPDPGIDEAISTSAATTGNLFRYDGTAQQYIFNLSTKLGYTNPGGSTVSFSTGTWTLKILLDDGQWYSVNVQLPR